MDGAPGIKGIDGAPGRDGTDGAPAPGFDEFEAEFDVETKTLTHRYTWNGRTKAYHWQVPLQRFRGVHESGTPYAAGDVVVSKGSSWIALSETTASPDEFGPGAKHWALQAKRGRDGKVGPTGPAGPEGRPGHDLTQMDTEGRKW